MIDRLYGDLLHNPDAHAGLDEPGGPDEPTDPSEAAGGAVPAGLVVFFSPRVPAGQTRVAGGEAA
ncbi:hypothetical protein [Pseudonocardia sp. Ae717_Ps2]|uniref:hypothetical protein n=1 Tax=Pseudonocardia sp. Ae717_Ps2 TaxID=1885573 RepID=UPI00094B3D2E|nr:hypothetical protein [Pseudonocardia sp. Ae717_Ps2]